MTEFWGLGALWFSLAVVATVCAIWFRVSTALTEIIVGTLAQLILGALFGPAVLGTTTPWIIFLAGAGAIMLTFLAGAELDPVVLRRNWKEATALGLVGFFAHFSAAPPSPIGFSAGASLRAGSPASRCQPHRSRSFMP